MHGLRGRASRLTMLVAAGALMLAACSNGDDGGSDETETDVAPTEESEPEATEPAGEPEVTEPAGEPEVAELTVGILPIVDVAPVNIAISEGLFAAEGLEVSTETMQGGAAAIPALVNGELDIAFGAWPSMFQALTQGIELRAVADGVVAAPGFTMILAGPGSELEGNPAALEGATVAVNTLDNLGELAVRSAVREAGGDDSAVDLVEVPFPEMNATLERGDVDAIWAVEPFATLGQQTLNATVVADSYTGPMESFPVAGFQVTADFAEQNPNTVAAFQRAMVEAAQLAQNDAELLRQTILDTTAIGEDLVDSLSYPRFSGDLAADTLQAAVDYLVEFGILQEPIDAASVTVPTE